MPKNKTLYQKFRRACETGDLKLLKSTQAEFENLKTNHKINFFNIGFIDACKQENTELALELLKNPIYYEGHYPPIRVFDGLLTAVLKDNLAIVEYALETWLPVVKTKSSFKEFASMEAELFNFACGASKEGKIQTLKYVAAYLDKKDINSNHLTTTDYKGFKHAWNRNNVSAIDFLIQHYALTLETPEVAEMVENPPPYMSSEDLDHIKTLLLVNLEKKQIAELIKPEININNAIKPTIKL